jgi:hypothetical protein
MPSEYLDILALPARLRELAVFKRKVAWSRATFQMWPKRLLGPHGCDTFAGTNDVFGGKQVLLDPVTGEPVFAEQLIVRALTAPGGPMTAGGWLDTYRCKFRDGNCRAETFATLPPSRESQLRSVCAALRKVLAGQGINDSARAPFCRGTWDVFCWRDANDLADALFVEAKGPEDSFAQPPEFKEPMWLEAALEASTAEGWGWIEANFRVVEWTATPVLRMEK